MASKSTNLLKPKPIKQLHSGKNANTANSLYSGIPSAQRAIQQQQHAFKSPSAWRFGQLKRERTPVVATGNSNPSSIYHPWESEYNQIITREKKLKSMTKDPYTIMPRLVSHAVENVATETEFCSPLIPAKGVKIESFKIQQRSTSLMPTIVRYLKHNELMPSERGVPSSTLVKPSSLSESQYKTPTVSVVNANMATGTAPNFATTHRLLNRIKMRDNPPVIRKPPRKLLLNATHETIMPLSVYG